MNVGGDTGNAKNPSMGPLDDIDQMLTNEIEYCSGLTQQLASIIDRMIGGDPPPNTAETDSQAWPEPVVHRLVEKSSALNRSHRQLEAQIARLQQL